MCPAIFHLSKALRRDSPLSIVLTMVYVEEKLAKTCLQVSGVAAGVRKGARPRPKAVPYNVFGGTLNLFNSQYSIPQPQAARNC